MIFKGGSGAGLNLSRIRSSRELLSSAAAPRPAPSPSCAARTPPPGRSSPAARPVARRRWSSSTSNHPDIAEFIELKANEENKIRVLRDAGYDMDLGGKDITSVQYQNANNSVRVSDEFMTAYEQGAEFGLRARTDGSVIDTVDARRLFRSLAEAAWACADPGIQYDGTINDWHTNPETGRITASNPCSEYMSLDDSSCNLASLNLLKFLSDRRHLRRQGVQPSASSWSSRPWRSRSPSPTSRPRRSARRPVTTASSASATPTSARC